MIMNLQEIVEGKRQWRTLQARVKALSPDYQVVYKEIQRYLYKVGPVELGEGNLEMLSGLADLFEEGAAAGKHVLEVTGADVAQFADGLVAGTPTYADGLQKSTDEYVGRTVDEALRKHMKKMK